MITISKLNKSFGAAHVLKSLNLIIPDGKVTAVLGPNGAGKTTLIKVILGLVKPDTGSIDINGIKINGESDYRQKIGYMPQSARYPENLTVREILDMVTDLRGNPEQTDQELFESFHLETEIAKAFKNLSGGNRQKVSAVLATMFCPDTLFLDEPTAGLDPVASSLLKDKIHRLRENGTTIILTSHIMSEVQELADEVVYLLDGTIFFRKHVSELMAETGTQTLERAIAEMMKSERRVA